MITEKGAIALIVCNVLALIAIFAQLQKIELITSTTVTFVVMAIITFPIAGIVADICVGRLKVIQASIVLLMVSSPINILLLLLQDYLPTTAQTVFVVCTAGLCWSGSSCYVACLFPLAADQLIGGFGEQLSFAVYWMMWGFVIAYYTVILKGISSVYFIL